MNTVLLKAAMVKAGVSQQEVQMRLNISKSALHRKMRGVTEFKQSEIQKIVTMLNMDDATVREVFFDEKVS